MKKMLYFDVLEASLLQIIANKNKVSITLRFGSILKQLAKMNPLVYHKINPNDIARVIREIFPIYKNNRRNTKAFKIRQKEALQYIRKNGINLRPIKHAYHLMCNIIN